MTLRTKTLSAVAALMLSTAGVAMAQDAATTAPDMAPAATPAPMDEPAEFIPPTDEVAPDQAAAEAVVVEPAATTDAAAAPEAPAEVQGDATTAEPAVDAAPEAAATEATMAEDEHAAADAPAAEDAHAAEEAGHEAAVAHTHGDEIRDVSFSFEGPFGKYDQHQLQRGLQVYTEVCAACHGLRYVPLRTLGDAGGPGLPEDQVRAYAANFSIYDPELDDERPRVPTDHFPIVPDVEATGPDLSLMAKGRSGFHGPYGTGINQFMRGIGGPEYIYSLLTGYTGHEVEQAGSVLYENTAFHGGLIAMPAPLSDELIEYQDGTPATVDQMAKDVSAFLMWTAEPKMMDRKQVGFVSVIFLVFLSALLYLTNKAIWAPHKPKHTPEA